ncbi:hypothetical protein DPEC_G00161710 [Dallia pectoralis]|uniref:Uncharacterized protein n=1 Tax=Dallia pectoralis TaxID=75939 RepID=A0ACC2GGP1_DALPE|nr:hypothetical protein DPEC_G00161710 [Dallia pectoralis]
MQTQLVGALVILLTCGVFCSDVEQEQQTMEEDMLSSLFTSKQSVPYWRVSLANVCRLVTRLVNRGSWIEQPYNSEEDMGERLTSHTRALDQLLELQHICRVLQPQELLVNSQQYLDGDQNSDNPLKRKSPYIFKRQVKNTKTRRPYILKRSTFY